MPRSANQKLKLLCLCKILWERTDEEHPLTVPELIQALEAWDIRAERKSIYDDMEALRTFGLDVQNRKGKAPGWFLGERPFQLAELKLLVDAVQSSKFITQRKSRELIRKLESQASVHQARQLQRQVYVDRRVKSMNESVYYTIDKLHTAIANRKAVTFKYFEYNVRKEKVFRREGKRYIVSPLGLIWDNENYYLAGYDHHREELRHYRVDKMAELAVTCLPLEGVDGELDIASYAQKHFGMFSGREGQITLRCANRLVGVVLDRFGREAMLVPDGADHFTVTVPARPLRALFDLQTELLQAGGALAAHEGGHLLNALQREGGRGQGLHGDGHELHGVVIRRHPVGRQGAAPAAAVDNGPLAVFPHPHGDGVHQSAAVGGAVAGLHVQVEAGQAVGAVVAVVRPRAGGDHRAAAVFAGKAVRTGVGLIVSALVLLALVDPVHGKIPPESNDGNTSGRAVVIYTAHQPPG